MLNFRDTIMRNLISKEITAHERRDFSHRRALPRVIRGAAFGLTMLALSIANPARALADGKIALVIGNSEYRKVDRLTNPANDAADMAASLGRLGFNVKHLSDLDFAAFRRALIDFGNAARTAEKAVIFFAGHGVEIDGKNWLIPVDAEIKSEVDVYAEAINLETLIDISVMPKVIGLVVLDACRNDPFASTNLAAGRALSNPLGKNAAKGSKDAAKKGGQTATRADPPKPASAPVTLADTSVRGLAPVEVNDNVLVAFAAAAGTTANDGTGRNSPYSGSLLRHVETPGLEINYIFRNVYDDVVRETKTQQPAVYGTLSREEIYLKGDATVAAAGAEAEAERVAWTFVRATNEIATLRRFAEQFPASSHVAEVRNRIAEIESTEKFAWSIVEKQNSVAAYRAFLDLYPFSEHVASARVTLASLQAAGQTDSGTVDLPKPATFQLAALPDATTKNPDSVDRAWDVLRDSRDKSVVGAFAEKFPSIRNNRLPAGSDLALRPVNPTDWMMRTGQDNDVNLCFTGDAASCVKAADKYPDYMQLRFQLCRVSGNKDRCMEKAVGDARQRGYLVSAYTRSEKEKVRNREYRRVVERVNQNVSNIVSNTVSNVVSTVVSNAVSQSVSNAVSMAVGNAAAAAASRAASGAAAAAASSAASRAASVAAASAAGQAASNAASSAAGRAASNAAATAAGNAASKAASSAAGKAASVAAANAAGQAASNAASRAASAAASSAASKAASNAASKAASNAASSAASKSASSAASAAASKAASNAASNAASRIPIPSDIRLKQDITALGRTPDGLPLYRYRYIGDDTFYVGVMAQEVAAVVPAAVSQMDDGYLQVDYGRLGLAFLTWRDWVQRHPADAPD
jgi:uncharacterized caspase-like protein